MLSLPRKVMRRLGLHCWCATAWRVPSRALVACHQLHQPCFPLLPRSFGLRLLAAPPFPSVPSQALVGQRSGPADLPTASPPPLEQVITNQAAFRRVQPPAGASAAAPQGPAAAGSFGGWGGFFRGAARPAGGAGAGGKPPTAGSYRLVVEPYHDEAACGSHGCPLCPSNLCKVGRAGRR